MTISLSDNAAERIAFLLSEEKENTKLRIAVDGGGCSGFQYDFDFVQSEEEGDLVIEKNGAKVLIDNISAEMMDGSVIDYIETLDAAHFEIKNPNAVSSCGCGNSFSA